MKNFQTIILIVFIVAAIFGILVFSGAIPIGNSDTPGALGSVTLWGTIKSELILSALEEFNTANTAFAVKYEEKSPETFDQDLLEALAAGRGPDLFLLPDYLAFHYQNKILAIPYENFSVASFKKNFAGAGEVFLTSRGILALPLFIDPLVMYYNRSILDASAIANPPVYWDEVLSMVPVITKKSEANILSRSAIALGQFANVAHAKDIIAALFMQVGNPIVAEKDGAFFSALNENSYIYNLPKVVKFYTSFADPLASVYSWNRSFANSSDAFSSENLAFYFGFGSELRSLINKNPNQNFLPAPIPQLKDAKFKLTSARVVGLAISQSSKNLGTAALASNRLANGDFTGKLAAALLVAPARRDLLSAPPNDAYSPVFYSSALFARSWLDPSPKDTDNIFRTLIERVLSNSLSPESALADADTKMNLLLNKQ